MPTEQFIARGGSEAEYEVYQALHRTGRREPSDFMFKPPGVDASFVVYAPRVALQVGLGFGAFNPFPNDSLFRFEVIDEESALDDADNALIQAIGGF